ncbi:MAG: hypothetical protein WBP34_02605 [Thermoanaerobaculia bacterium]
MSRTKWVLAVLAMATIASLPSRAEWDIEIGTAGLWEMVHSVQQTRDGGYIVAAWVGYSGVPATFDLGVLKLDRDGTVVWQKAYGGVDDERPYSIRQTSDGGYIVAGITASFASGGDGDWDAWVMKLDSDGSVLWQRTYGGDKPEFAYSIRQTADGGYILIGTTQTFAPPCGPFCSYTYTWVLRLQPDGSPVWTRVFPGGIAHTIEQTQDGGFILAGYRSGDLQVIKLGPGGGIEVQWAYPGLGGYHVTSAIRQTDDLGFVVTATTENPHDVWIMKLNPDWTTAWQKTYGSEMADRSHSVLQTTDGGYVVAAGTCLPAPCYPMDDDVWLFKLDPSGNVLWSRLRQGLLNIFSSSPIELKGDGGYLVGARTLVPGVTGDSDMLLLSLDAEGKVPDPTCTQMEEYSPTVMDAAAERVHTDLVTQGAELILGVTEVAPVDLQFDQFVNCWVEEPLFTVGFESGDTSSWTSIVQ